MNNKDQIRISEKSIKRGGEWINLIISRANETGILLKEDILSIHNTYGVNLTSIMLLAKSHHLNGDWEGFYKLLDLQIDEHKNMKKCGIHEPK